MPHLATYIFFLIQLMNEPGLGAEIDPGMALTPLPSSIGLGLNPRPSDCEPRALPLDHSFRYWHKKYVIKNEIIDLSSTVYFKSCTILRE